MPERTDAWAVLADRGEWRGADAVAAAALAVREPPNGQVAPPALPARPAPGPAAPPRRRLPGALVASVAFVVVVAAVGASILVAGRADGPATTAGALTDASPPVTAAEVVPPGDWPTPALDAVLALPACATQPESPTWFVPDRFFDFLGVRGAGLTPVVPSQVATTTPMLRAGHGSMLSLDAIEGGCVAAASGGPVTAWALYLASGAPAMIALSTPAPAEFPDHLTATPGTYEQWRIATGEHFNGNVAADGQVHAVTNHRLYVAEFDPALVPTGEAPGGWLLASLAVAPGDTEASLGALEVPEIVPAAAPPGFGLCAATHAFMFETTPEVEEENIEIVLCNAAGEAVTITGGTLPDPPAGAETVTINGRPVARWANALGHGLQLGRGGYSVRVEAAAPVGVDVVTAVMASLPLTSLEPSPPTDAAVRVGVGDGLDPGLTEFADPDGVESFSYAERAAEVRDGGIEVQLSESMQAIQAEGLAGLDPLPIAYRYERLEDGSWESADFALGSGNVRISILQQAMPPGTEFASPVSRITETWGAWEVGARTEPDSHTQVVAYSPSIGRMVNLWFGRLAPDAPYELTEAEARAVAARILAAVAAPS